MLKQKLVLVTVNLVPMFIFGNKGKGAYAGIGFGNLSTDLTFYEDLDGGERGKGTIGLDIKSTNLKFGIKTGGRFYFRF